MICIKFDQKIKNLKNLNFGLLKFFVFKKKPKKPRFFSKPFSSPGFEAEVFTGRMPNQQPQTTEGCTAMHWTKSVHKISFSVGFLCYLTKNIWLKSIFYIRKLQVISPFQAKSEKHV